MRADICPLFVRGVRGGWGLLDSGRADVRMTGGLPHTPPSHILHPTVAMATARKPGTKSKSTKSKMREKRGGGGVDGKTGHEVMIVMELMTHRSVNAGCCNTTAEFP